MAEKRQIQFECYTNLPLGGNWAGKWPAYVLVHHEGAVDDVRYVPERTCHMVDNGCELCCSECDCRHDYDDEPNYCHNCGARVVSA